MDEELYRRAYSGTLGLLRSLKDGTASHDKWRILNAAVSVLPESLQDELVDWLLSKLENK